MVNYCGSQGSRIIEAPVQWVQEQAIDGEVAALHVFGGAEGVVDFVGMTAIGVDAVGAEGRDLHVRHLRWG